MSAPLKDNPKWGIWLGLIGAAAGGYFLYKEYKHHHHLPGGPMQKALPAPELPTVTIGAASATLDRKTKTMQLHVSLVNPTRHDVKVTMTGNLQIVPEAGGAGVPLGVTGVSIPVSIAPGQNSMVTLTGHITGTSVLSFIMDSILNKSLRHLAIYTGEISVSGRVLPITVKAPIT